MIDEYLVVIEKLRARRNELILNNESFVRVKMLEDEILDLEYAISLMCNPCRIFAPRPLWPDE